MDPVVYEEIVSNLARFGRPDLILEFKEHVTIDPLYEPSKDILKNRFKKEIYSEDECSASDEELSYQIDQDGFYQLE